MPMPVKPGVFKRKKRGPYISPGVSCSSSLAAKGRYLPRTLSRNALPVSGNPIPAACRRNCVRKRWEKRRAYRLADKERLSAYPVWILSPGSCRPLFLPAPVASPSALRGVPIATTRSGVYGKRKCSSCSCFNGYLKVSAALRDTFGQTVIGYRSVADVVLQYAAVLERKAAEHALPQFFEGVNTIRTFLIMLFARKLLISSTPSLLKVRRKVPKPGIFTVCPCWSCWGTNLARSSSEASISMGAVVVLAVAAHVIAFGGRVPFARFLSFLRIHFLN